MCLSLSARSVSPELSTPWDSTAEQSQLWGKAHFQHGQPKVFFLVFLVYIPGQHAVDTENPAIQANSFIIWPCLEGHFMDFPQSFHSYPGWIKKLAAQLADSLSRIIPLSKSPWHSPNSWGYPIYSWKELATQLPCVRWFSGWHSRVWFWSLLHQASLSNIVVYIYIYIFGTWMRHSSWLNPPSHSAKFQSRFFISMRLKEIEGHEGRREGPAEREAPQKKTLRFWPKPVMQLQLWQFKAITIHITIILTLT